MSNKDIKESIKKVENPSSAGRPPAGHRPGGRGPHGFMPGEKAKDMKGTLKRLVSYMGPYRWAFVLVLIMTLGATLFNIIGPQVLGNVTSMLFAGNFDFLTIGRLLLTVLGLYLLSYVLTLLMGWKMARISTDISYRLRKDLSQKMNRLPLRYYDKTTHGDVLSRITNDVEVINQTLSQSMAQMFTSAVTVIGVTVMMFRINLWLSLAAMLIIPASLGLVRFIVKKSQKHFRTRQGTLGQLNGHIEEIYSGQQVVKLYNGEEKSRMKFQALNEELFHSAWKSQFLSGLMMPLMGFISNLGYVVVAILGSYLTVTGQIRIGDVQAFLQYIRNFTYPITSLANISNVLQQTAAAAERIFQFLDEKEQEADAKEALDLESCRGEVEFRNIHFGYDSKNPVIKDFSVKVKAGQKIAIVGPTGAGKTTLVKLLMRFYDVDSGSILVDGRDIREYKRSALRSAFAMVLQDTWLFNGSIMENIRFAREDASDQEVMAAARTSHAEHFINTLPESFQMELNEETSNISQGQRQLLTIARAVLPEPPILILDEATSSVDTRTEELIQKAMDNVMKNRTSFIIAHRLSTIQNADWILVLNEGDIVEQGTHHQLLKQEGFYADLYNSQFEPAWQAG